MDMKLLVSQAFYDKLKTHKPTKREGEGLAGLLSGVPLQVSSHLPYTSVEADGSTMCVEAVLCYQGLHGTTLATPLSRNFLAETALEGN